MLLPHALHDSERVNVTCRGGVGSVLARAARGGRRRACQVIKDDKFVQVENPIKTASHAPVQYSKKAARGGLEVDARTKSCS